MRKHITYIFVLVLMQQSAMACFIFEPENTFHDQLIEFNPNWKYHIAEAPAGEAQHFYSDQDYVFVHLSSVIPILQASSVEHLTQEQQTTRSEMIATLNEYRKGHNFPINYYRQERIPVFIDEHDTHCAVGYLLQQSGHEAIARRIAAADNYVWVKDIDDPALPAWQEASGLSVAELKLIQGAYDFYPPDAFSAPNKYEIPQEPKVIIIAFYEPTKESEMAKSPELIWLEGEGVNGVLNGRWTQNYGVGIPWIEGFYANGKRSGQWKEYYKGTAKLCRTENWRNDELNGVRKRFDRQGKLVEEIMFKNGKAITKTNYDLQGALKTIRTPLDSVSMYTEVYTLGGGLLAVGNETVYNPGNLLWFQNIELTALNSVQITSRDESVSYVAGSDTRRLYNAPPLVEYKKEGEWVYYKEYKANLTEEEEMIAAIAMIDSDYPHFGPALSESIQLFEGLQKNSSYDSIRVSYTNNFLQHFYGYGASENTHLEILYHQDLATTEFTDRVHTLLPERTGRFTRYGGNLTQNFAFYPTVKSIGAYNAADLKVGVWKHFNERQQLYKTETFIIPRKEENVVMR
jgi:antitoxin component YwqK of YwqJK toxin-antitoxin module